MSIQEQTKTEFASAIPLTAGQIIVATDHLTARLDPEKPEQGSELIARVREALRQDGFSGKSLTDAITVLTEMVTNAIEHGCAGRPESWVDVEALLARTHARFRVRNPGPGFDVEQALKRSCENLVSPTSLRGRGLALIKLISARAEFVEQGRLAEAVIMKTPPDAEEIPVDISFLKVLNGKAALLKPGDNLNCWGVPSLISQAERLLDFGYRYMFLDLSCVTGADSAGLGFIFAQQQKCRAAGGNLFIVGLSAQLDHLFQLIHLGHIIPCFATLDEALASLQAS